jgi:hypothetical protein
MSTPNVGGLVVYDQDGELSPDTTRYRIVEAAVHLALCLLETSKGRRSMVDVATAIIQERDDHRPQPLHHIYQDDLQNMPNWIRTFLQRMRNDFPAVKIHKAVKGEASAERYDWGNNMNQYIAGEAGVLWMSEAILSNMTYLYENRTIPGNRYSYKLFKFQMVISVAHEIMHFLTGFLTGSVKPSTPKGVTAQPYGTSRIGEAGRYWESMLLGGFVEFWSEPDHPLGRRQPGVPYLFKSGSRSNGTGQQVSRTYIEEFIDNERKTSRDRAPLDLALTPLRIRLPHRHGQRDSCCDAPDADSGQPQGDHRPSQY